MRIHKYGIILTRIKEKDIELIREKRNSDEIRANMLFREIISPDKQKEWFKSINNIYNNYFIIEANNKQIGLINGKNINYNKLTSEGGMFIWDKDQGGTINSALASIIMSDFNFIINEFEKNYIQILRFNHKAISYNKQLGYVPTQDHPSNEESQWFELTKENYLKNREKLKKVIAVNTHDSNLLSVDDFEFKDDSEQEFLELYSPLPEYLKKKINYCLMRDGLPLLVSGDKEDTDASR
jgi:UDP-4-amino-4,6-dideoxy-N-acetyl-beta-L-altrosamine N-acetyltransferase